jgi:hypothetical protein
MSTARILSLVIGISPAFGYATTSNRPFARPFGTETDSLVFPRKDVAKKTKATYDLGLGKNQPFYGGKSNSQISMTYEVTQYLVEHEAVRAYPSPVVVDEQQSPSSSSATKKRPALPRVQLERQSKDTLKIKNRGDFVPHIRATSDDKLDLNTVWVEMMIHSEQMKL